MPIDPATVIIDGQHVSKAALRDLLNELDSRILAPEVAADYAWFGTLNPDRIECYPRLISDSQLSLVNSSVMLTSFIAPWTKQINALTLHNNNSAGVGMTYAAMGLYTVAANGDLSLVARTDSDTSLMTATFTTYTRALSTTGGYPASYLMEYSQRYALGVLVTGATTVPSPRAKSTTGPLGAAMLPRIGGRTGTIHAALPAA